MQWSKPHSAPCCPEDGVQHYTELAGSGQGALLGHSAAVDEPHPPSSGLRSELGEHRAVPVP